MCAQGVGQERERHTEKQKDRYQPHQRPRHSTSPPADLRTGTQASARRGASLDLDAISSWHFYAPFPRDSFQTPSSTASRPSRNSAQEIGRPSEAGERRVALFRFRFLRSAHPIELRCATPIPFATRRFVAALFELHFQPYSLLLPFMANCLSHLF